MVHFGGKFFRSNAGCNGNKKVSLVARIGQLIQQVIDVLRFDGDNNDRCILNQFHIGRGGSQAIGFLTYGSAGPDLHRW